MKNKRPRHENMPRPFFRIQTLRDPVTRGLGNSMSRSFDLRFAGCVPPSRVSPPVTDFRHERASTLTAAVPFVIYTRFTILSDGFAARRSTHA